MKIITGFVETSGADIYERYCYVMTDTRYVSPEYKGDFMKYWQLEGTLRTFEYCFKHSRKTTTHFVREMFLTIGENTNYRYAKNVNVE